MSTGVCVIDMRIPTILILAVIFIGCSDQNQNKHTETASNSNSAKPSPKPTLSDEERDRERKEINAAQFKAIDEFIIANHKGWSLQGIAGDSYSSECEEDEPCDLNLANNTKSKVVTVILKHFYRKDGSKYWLVREARSFDLSKAKIAQIKQSAIESAIENLSIEDVSENLKDEIIQNYREDLQSSISE